MSQSIKTIKIKLLLILFILLSWSQLAFSYIHNQTKSGIPIHWPSSSSTIDLYVNSENKNLNEADVQSISLNSINQWNGLSAITLRKNATTLRNQADLNELSFSSDPAIFSGTGVIGITLVNYSETSGEILSADILINNDYPFNTNNSKAIEYLGNVITHEVGHFLGLGHGQVIGSSMFYALSYGQSQLSDDDKSGVYSIYPNSHPSKGSLTGTIIGGRNLAVVFGTHVQAISVKSGKVMGASISEINGKFKIDGLPMNDQYILYTSPIKQMGLPATYANVKSDFCDSSAKYRGSFFQSCGSSQEGFPEAVKLSTSSLDVGKITIRCSMDSPPEYIQNKNITPSGFNITDYTGSGLGGNFVGFFSAPEILQSGVHDYFQINFSNVDNWNIYSELPLYLELKVMNQSFNSAFKANVQITRTSTGEITEPAIKTYIQETDGWPNLETLVRVPINVSNSSDNDFEVNISPEAIAASYPSGIPVYTKNELFPMEESLYFYLVTATIVKKNPDGSYTQVASKNDLLSDNTLCPDAINTYSLTDYSAKGITSSSNRKKAAGCGIVVDANNGSSNGQGPGGFMVGLLLCYIISYALTRYSKMA